MNDILMNDILMNDILMNEKYIKPKHINFDIINYLIKCDNMEYIYRHKVKFIDPNLPINKNYILKKETKHDFEVKQIFIKNDNIIEKYMINDIIYYYKLKYISEIYDFNIKLDNPESIKNFFETIVKYDEQEIVQNCLDGIKKSLKNDYECLIESNKFNLCFILL